MVISQNRTYVTGCAGPPAGVDGGAFEIKCTLGAVLKAREAFLELATNHFIHLVVEGPFGDRPGIQAFGVPLGLPRP